MLTVAQYNRLPQIARAVVDADRAIRTEKAAPITDIASYRELVSDRRSIVKAAGLIWGAPLKGDGTARS